MLSLKGIRGGDMRVVTLVVLMGCSGGVDTSGRETGAMDTAPDVTDDPNDIDTDPPDGTRFCEDADRDGWGSSTQCVVRKEPPEGYIVGSGDCDDANPAVYPGAVEVDEDIDEDCDGIYAETFAECDVGQWCIDADGDGFGDPDRCVNGEEPDDDFRYVDNDNDCNDASAGVYPGASEDSDDGVDEDCDGVVDESWTQAVVCAMSIDAHLRAAELFVWSPQDQSMWPQCDTHLAVWPQCDISAQSTEIYGASTEDDAVPELLYFSGESGWTCGTVVANYGDDVVVGGLGLAGDRVRLVVDTELDPVSLMRVRIDGEEGSCVRDERTFICTRPYRTHRTTRCAEE